MQTLESSRRPTAHCLSIDVFSGLATAAVNLYELQSAGVRRLRSVFPEHFPISEDEVKELWKTALIVLDANTLLNFYRYSDSTRSEFSQVLNELKERIYIPEQAGYEYFENRLQEIVAQNKSYTETKNSIDELRGTLTRERGHPFISPKTLERLQEDFSQACKELDENQRRLIDRLTNDDILLEIADILDKCVGKGFSGDELERIFVEGESRYAEKVPPGFKDTKKYPERANVREKRSVFGDFIVWKQMQLAAKENGSGVIFVTDDLKEDWWLVVNGRTIGPRPELISEFMQVTGKRFHSYKPEQFLQYAKDHLKSDVSPETLEEVASNRPVREGFSAEHKGWSSDSLFPSQGEVFRRSRKDSDLSFFSGSPHNSPLHASERSSLTSIDSLPNLAEQLRNEIVNLFKRRGQIFEEIDDFSLTSRKLSESNPHDSDIMRQSAELKKVRSFLLKKIHEIDYEIARKQSQLSDLMKTYASKHIDPSE